MDKGEDRESLSRLSWPSVQQILAKEVFEVVWAQPEERHLPAAVYADKYGDPASNGRGDMAVEGPGGTELVSLQQLENMLTSSNEQIGNPILERARLF